MNILDIATNSVTAKATLIQISVEVDYENSLLTLEITDNGCGMDVNGLGCAVDPFHSSKNGHIVGLGLPLLKQRAELTGGFFRIESQKGKGTVVTALFNSASVDFVPLGDIASTLVALATANEGIDFVYTEKRGENRFVFDTRTLKEGSSSFAVNVSTARLIFEYIKKNSIL